MKRNIKNVQAVLKRGISALKRRYIPKDICVPIADADFPKAYMAEAEKNGNDAAKAVQKKHEASKAAKRKQAKQTITYKGKTVMLGKHEPTEVIFWEG